MRTTQLQINQERFLSLLTEVVKKKKLTKMEIEKRYGIKYTTFRQWEKGFSVPSTSNWEVLANVLDLSLKDFIFYISDMEEEDKNKVYETLKAESKIQKTKKTTTKTTKDQRKVSVQNSQIISSHINNSQIAPSTNSSPKNIVELLNIATKEEIFTLVCYLSPTVRNYFQCALDSTQSQIKNKGLFADFSEFS